MRTLTLKAAAVAVCGALAGSVYAGDITLYGSVSTGLVMQNTSKLTHGADKIDSVNSLSMESGWNGDSIWGLTGQEDLGNGWSVGFTLENEFASDTGALASDGKIFDSQAYLRVGNSLVNFAAGNISGLSSAGGDFDMIGGFDPMGVFFGVGGMGAFATRDYASDNMLVAELTPVEGLKISAMGSVGEDDSEAKWHRRTHYYGVGASYETGALAVAGVVEMTSYNNTLNAAAQTDDDALAFSLGVSYDFGVVKPSFVYQHADKLRSFQGEGTTGAYNFDSFLLGATAPMGGGTLMASVQYVKAENDADAKDEGNATILALAYNYELSKRTALWCGATYAVGGDGLDKDLSVTDKEFSGIDRAAYNGYTVGVGLTHTF